MQVNYESLNVAARATTFLRSMPKTLSAAQQKSWLSFAGLKLIEGTAVSLDEISIRLARSSVRRSFKHTIPSCKQAESLETVGT